ncbi:MAG TPA: hypothetical protein VHL10_07135 [Nitrososphaera sp.]|jgi:hypothetical protein|nr:hypothetical protein [Nitrososphaera sp.]
MGQNADLAKSGTPFTSGAAAQSGILTKKPTVVFALTVQSVTAQYVMLYDATAVPSNTDVTAIEIVKLAANDAKQLIFPTGKVFGKGVVWATSSTAPALTLGGSDAHVSITADVVK